MLEPAEPSRGWTVLLIGLLAAAAMLGAGRLSGWRRTLVAVAAIVPLSRFMLMAGRVADELLLPSGWSELAGGISRGISDLPGVRVPYRGLDEWVRTVIPLGGSVLVLLAALLAFWPRRSRLGFPGAALLVLIVLYVVPVVALDFTGEFLRGGVFTLLMIAFLRLEKLRGPDAAAAGALAAVATIVALAAAPVLNRDQPWWDYESWALETSSSKSTSFTWDHSYGQLNWPRDGRELLRVKAKTPAYWKAENLDDFDGSIWRRSQLGVQVPESHGRRRAGARGHADPAGLDPQPAHGPVHHRGLRVRRQDPEARRPAHDGRDLSRPAHAAARRHLHRPRVHPAPARGRAPAGGRGVRRFAADLHPHPRHHARAAGREFREHDVPVLRRRVRRHHQLRAAGEPAGRGRHRDGRADAASTSSRRT